MPYIAVRMGRRMGQKEGGKVMVRDGGMVGIAGADIGKKREGIRWGHERLLSRLTWAHFAELNPMLTRES